MQEGYSLEAICGGLGQGIARNILDVLVKGRNIHEPAGLIGGVSLNKKIVAGIEEILGVRVLVPDHAHLAGAVGTGNPNQVLIPHIHYLKGSAAQASFGDPRQTVN